MVYSFSELTPEVGRHAGGKGATLAKLYQAGYPVPDGSVLLTEAFNGHELRQEAWERAQRTLVHMRSSGNQPEQMRFAVRSSAMQEDSSQASFAGEFATVLNVCSDDEIRAAVSTVRRSVLNERVQAYSRAKGAAGDQQVAVVIQQMVSAELSGVLFTADPVSGSHAYMVGDVTRGLGEKLVSGETSGERFRLKRPSGKYEGPTYLRRYARRLYKMARRLERELGGPQDIEFAIADGKLYLLQARPVTTFRARDPTTGAWNDTQRGDYLWANTNFGEALPDVMTPYTWSIFQIYFSETFPYTLPGNHPIAGNIGGRFYINVSLFASLVAALKLNPRKMLGNDETFGRIPDWMEIPILPFSLSEVMRAILPVIIKARRRVNQSKADLPCFMRESQELAEQYRIQIGQAATPAGLLQLWHDSIEEFVRRASRALQASMSALQASSAKLRDDLTKLVGTEDTAALVAGVGQLESMGPMLGLTKVARGEMSRQEYFRRYGHRGPHEAELSEPRPAEDPNWIEHQLAQLRSGGETSVSVEELLSKQRARHERARNRLITRYPRQAKSLKRRLDRAAEAYRLREQVRSEATRMLWVAREFALRAGQLTGLGEKIFFLSVDEIQALLDGDDSAVAYLPARRRTHEAYRALPPYPSIIRGRFDPFQWANDAERRSDIFVALQETAEEVPAAEKGVITGFPGAAGTVEGLVRQLDSLDEGIQLQGGEILVANTTNIGWTPLFPRAAAVVTDIGAPLSHAAIVARELGIPAVVGCGDATMRLATGDRVRVDGALGRVEILQSPD